MLRPTATLVALPAVAATAIAGASTNDAIRALSLAATVRLPAFASTSGADASDARTSVLSRFIATTAPTATACASLFSRRLDRGRRRRDGRVDRGRGRRRHGHGPGGADRRALRRRDRRGRGLVAELRPEDRVGEVEEDVLRVPADRVERERDADADALGRRDARRRRGDRGAVRGGDRHVACGRRHAAVDDARVRAAEDDVRRDRGVDRVRAAAGDDAAARGGDRRVERRTDDLRCERGRR